MLRNPGKPLAPATIVHQAKTLPMMIAMPLVVIAALLMGWSLVASNPVVGILAALTLIVLLVGLWAPFWALVLLLAQFAILPCEGPFFGYYVPNILQTGVPLVVALALLAAMKRRSASRLTTADLLLIGLGLWGIIGLFANDALPYWKQYGNKILYPMGFYYIVRLLPFDRANISRLLKVNLVVVGVQSVLMIRQGTVGYSSIYTTQNFCATGPFGYFWEAAPYLALWAPLFIYVAHRSKSSGWRVLCYLGVLLDGYAITLTMQRGASAAWALSILFCLLSPSLRPTMRKLLMLGFLAYIPWATSNLGEDLLNRFDETDQSRAAYREAGYAILRSPKWNPVWGIGFYQSANTMRRVDSSFIRDRQLTVWGRRSRSVTSLAEEGRPVHNLYLSLLIEFGVVGALIGVGLAFALIKSVYRAYRLMREGHAIDDGLYISLLASLLAWGGVAYIHNIYRFEATMSVFWFIYGIIVGHPEAFRIGAKTADAAEEPVAAGKGKIKGAGRFPKKTGPFCDPSGRSQRKTGPFCNPTGRKR